MFEKIRMRYAVWKDWCLTNYNTKLYKLLVLLKLIESPTFNMAYSFRRLSTSFDKIFKS